MTFTRLTLGEPRLRSKVRGGAVEEVCEEPLEYGANILLDPGAEQENAQVGTAVGGAIPAWSGTDSFYGWGQNAPTAATHWYLQDDSPRTGTYVLKAERDSGSTSQAQSLLVPVRQDCPAEGTTTHDRLHRIEAGDFAEFSAYFTSSWSTSTQPSFTLTLAFRDVDGLSAGGTATNSLIPFPASYTQFSVDAIAPSSAYKVRPQITVHVPFSELGNVILWADDFALEVQP